MKPGPRPRPIADRIDEKIAKTETGCWLWTASVDSHGYAQIGIGSRSDGSMSVGRVHRLIYELLVGPIPEGLDIDHLCRVRNCVNPQHLEPVTRSENLRRSPLVGRTRGNR